MSIPWREAWKKFNEERSANGGGKYTIPKKGTPEYDRVKALQAGPQTNILADASKRSKSKTPPKEKKEPKLEELPVDTEAAPKPVKAKAKMEESITQEEPPVETEAKPGKAKAKVKKPDAPLPFSDGLIRFD